LLVLRVGPHVSHWTRRVRMIALGRVLVRRPLCALHLACPRERRLPTPRRVGGFPPVGARPHVDGRGPQLHTYCVRAGSDVGTCMVSALNPVAGGGVYAQHRRQRDHSRVAHRGGRVPQAAFGAWSGQHGFGEVEQLLNAPFNYWPKRLCLMDPWVLRRRHHRWRDEWTGTKVDLERAARL
jgi:hypothetical protein